MFNWVLNTPLHDLTLNKNYVSQRFFEHKPYHVSMVKPLCMLFQRSSPLGSLLGIFRSDFTFAREQALSQLFFEGALIASVEKLF